MSEHRIELTVNGRRIAAETEARALALAKTTGAKAALAVLEGGSMTDEAEKCGLTRQAVHQALRRLARRADFHYEDEPTRK
jgi:DNA-binding MarR family transcriptional regulator